MRARLFLAAVILAALPGCAGTRSQLVATWEPEPDVRIAYRLDLGNATYGSLRGTQDERGTEY